MLIIKVDFERFCEEFNRYDRKSNFSYEAKKALYEYLEESVYTELDIIGLCCDFREYTDVNSLCYNYGIKEIEDLNNWYEILDTGSVLVKNY